MTFSSRNATPHDASSINDLYAVVTNRQRTIKQYIWQWWSYPSPPSFSYVILHTYSDSQERIVGHHGVMSLIFHYNSKTYLVGKTENTMVHPDLRARIIYPRYEQKFLNEYKPFVAALFSTSGPTNAIKTRYLLGYKPIGCYKVFVFIPIVTRLIGVLSRSLMTFPKRASTFQVVHAKDVDPNYINQVWNSARSNYPFTPSRDYQQFRWRFALNPYKNHYILMNISGYLVFSRDSNTITIIDIFPVNPCHSSFYTLLVDLAYSSPFHSILKCRFCLDNSCAAAALASALLKFAKRNLLYFHSDRQPMPRYIVDKDIPIDSWFITGFVGEGR